MSRGAVVNDLQLTLPSDANAKMEKDAVQETIKHAFQTVASTDDVLYRT